MSAKAVFTFVCESGSGFTRDKQYPAFELFGGFQTVNDDGELVGVGGNPRVWRLDGLAVDEVSVWERKQPEDVGKKGENHGRESVTGGLGTEGRQAASAEDGAQAGFKNRKGG